jgi:hypothetical protein
MCNRVSSHGGPLSGVPIFYGTPSTFLRSRARRTLGVPNLPGCPRKSGSWSVEDSEDSSSLHVPPLLFGRPLCEDTSSRSGASSPLQFRKIMMHRPIRDVQKDYEDFLNALDKARSDNDEARILFYDTACRNLLDEMRLMSNNN